MELVAMIAQRQWLPQVPGQRIEFREVLNPDIICSLAEADFLGPARVAKAQHRFWKRRGLCCICEEGRYLLDRHSHAGV